MTTASPSTGIRAWLQGRIPLTASETINRVIAGALTFLLGYGVLDGERAALWSQLALGTVAALFSMLYATTSARVALYALVGPVGGVLMAYGLIQDQKWAVIVASLGQVFGVATAAAKTVELVPAGLSGVATLTGQPGITNTASAVVVRSPREASALRRRRRAPRQARPGATAAP